jgi:branched-chain amino acid transport system substrate-binding protein
MNRRLAAAAAIAAAATMVLAACGKSDNGGGGTTTDNTGKTLIIGVDLPFQGSSADTSKATFNAMQLYLDSVGSKAGKYTVKLQQYDDSTAAAGKWDQATCDSNATKHVNNADEVAVMGTYNSGCAIEEIPTLNQAPNGPMLMVSHANTNPGLTKKWDPNTPDKYYPTGKRNYARVITTDDYQGTAAARFAKSELNVTKCFVLNDNEIYGQGIAQAFADEATKQGIEVVGTQAWDGKQPNYTALFQSVKAKNPDCVYLGGIYDNNGGQLIKDKVAVLGDNTKVKLLAPDGFTGYPDEDKLAEAQGEYLTFAGLDQSQLAGGTGPAATLLKAYKDKYGAEPDSSYALYGVQALQVILQAISQSDGTRASVTAQVFSGAGIEITADKSVIGKDIKIDPKSGDVNTIDISILQMKDNKETFLKPFPVA